MPDALPDVERLLVAYLPAAIPGLYVCTELPAEPRFSESLPVVRVARIGGVRTIPAWGSGFHAEDARMSIDVWAASRADANATVGAVRLALEGLTAQTRDDVQIIRTREETGPAERPDEPNTTTRRIGWTAALTVRPT